MRNPEFDERKIETPYRRNSNSEAKVFGSHGGK
jgi:hypothetical protein